MVGPNIRKLFVLRRSAEQDINYRRISLWNGRNWIAFMRPNWVVIQRSNRVFRYHYSWLLVTITVDIKKCISQQRMLYESPYKIFVRTLQELIRVYCCYFDFCFFFSVPPPTKNEVYPLVYFTQRNSLAKH